MHDFLNEQKVQYFEVKRRVNILKSGFSFSLYLVNTWVISAANVRNMLLMVLSEIVHRVPCVLTEFCFLMVIYIMWAIKFESILLNSSLFSAKLPQTS